VQQPQWGGRVADGVDLKALRIAGGYALCGVLWIAFSDQAIVQLVADADELTRLQTWKGGFFVFATASLVFFLSRRVLARQADLIEELRTSESEVRTLNAELEARVRERTAQLEAANQALEAFSYSVSHDLKAPLRGIDGYSQIVLEDYAPALGDEGRRFLANIRRGVAQMHRLIDDLLAYSRMERRTIARAPIALAPLVRAVAAERAAEMAQRQVQLRMEMPDITVAADLDGLAIVLRNLLGNALKFSTTMPAPQVEIGAHTEAGKVSLWVRDNGIGFDMKFHERIFEIFSRLERDEDYPGSGVGLALVRKAVQRMGGRVWATSTPGEGATFFVELPA